MNLFQEFFVEPMINPLVQGYNLVNTLVFVLILIIACCLIFVVLRKKIVFDLNFLIALLPFIIVGTSLRTIMHQIESNNLVVNGIFKTANPFELGFWFFTPGVWFLTFFLVVIGLIISFWGGKFDYKKLFFVGLFFSIPLLIFNFLSYNNWFVFLFTILVIIMVVVFLLKLVDSFSKYKILSNKLNFFIVLGQGIDGIASAIAVTFFSFSEQHVVSAFLLDLNPLLFVSVKLIIGVLLCWSIDDFFEDVKSKSISNKKSKSLFFVDAQLVNFVKIIIAILGLSTGLGSLLKLGII